MNLVFWIEYLAFCMSVLLHCILYQVTLIMRWLRLWTAGAHHSLWSDRRPVYDWQPGDQETGSGKFAESNFNNSWSASALAKGRQINAWKSFSNFTFLIYNAVPLHLKQKQNWYNPTSRIHHNSCSVRPCTPSRKSDHLSPQPAPLLATRSGQSPQRAWRTKSSRPN